MYLMELMSNGDLKTFLRKCRPDEEGFTSPPPDIEVLYYNERLQASRFDTREPMKSFK